MYPVDYDIDEDYRENDPEWLENLYDIEYDCE